MAVVPVELYAKSAQASGGAGQIERHYKIPGVPDPVDALDYGPAFGEQYPGRESLVVLGKSAEPMDESMCELTVTYGVPSRSGGAQDSWELDMTAGTERITQVKKEDHQTHYDYTGLRPPGATLTVGTAIGLNGDDVDGVDIYTPKGSLSITEWKSSSEITDDYQRLLMDKAGTMNESTFGPWIAKEALFIGAVISNTEGERVRVTFKFLISRKQTGIKFDVFKATGANKTEISVDKEGWDYLWTRTAKRLERESSLPEARSRTVTGILDVHVAQVYDTSDFSLLGVRGTSGWSHRD